MTITASPINGTPPGAAHRADRDRRQRQGHAELDAPASDGGEAITAYEVFRGTLGGTETLLTSGGCSDLAAVLTCAPTPG